MEHKTHAGHGHQHGDGCGHSKIRHDDHVDYIHDGHLHNAHEGHVDEHVLAVAAGQPSACDDSHACAEHESGHRHGASCGHERVPHGDHADYAVATHLHNHHGDHCDDHGAIAWA